MILRGGGLLNTHFVVDWRFGEGELFGVDERKEKGKILRLMELWALSEAGTSGGFKLYPWICT